MKLGSTSLMQGIAKDSNYQTPDWDRSRNCLILELLNCNNGIFPPESKGTSIFGYPTLLVGFLIWNRIIRRGFSDDPFIKTLPKAQRTRGLSSSFQSNLFGHITSSNTNLNQTSSSKSRPSIYFKISTKHHHLD